jgi:hypothetical protein
MVNSDWCFVIHPEIRCLALKRALWLSPGFLQHQTLRKPLLTASLMFLLARLI